MLHLHLVFIGKTTFPELDAGIQRYLERLRHYVLADVHVVRAEKLTPKVQEEQVREREADRVVRLLGKQDYVIAWDSRGQQMESPELAMFLKKLIEGGISNVWMIIGGPVGLSQKLREQAQTILSFSKMTFPHDLSRLIVLEQLYRAFTILRGEPYHK
jgi:23S rRNA (pseudouridine1915-N3)-methyltransferase